MRIEPREQPHVRDNIAETPCVLQQHIYGDCIQVKMHTVFVLHGSFKFHVIDMDNLTKYIGDHQSHAIGRMCLNALKRSVEEIGMR